MWTLLLSRAGDPPGSFFDRRHLDAGELKIGRSAAMCDIVLPDEQRVVSRTHCTISAHGLELFVVDTSAHGVALNDPAARITPHMPVSVRANDRLIIGGFVVTIATEAMGAGVAIVPPPPPPLPGMAAPRGEDQWFDAPADPMWDDGPQSGGMHDFLSGAIHDMLAPPPGAALPPAAFGIGDALSQAFSRPIMAEPMHAPSDFGIPEDWLSGPSNGGGAPAADPFAPTPARGDPFAPSPARDDPFAPSPARDDPFAPSPAGGDPFAPAPAAFDPFASPSSPGGDPFGGGDAFAASPPASDPFAPAPAPASGGFSFDDPPALSAPGFDDPFDLARPSAPPPAPPPASAAPAPSQAAPATPSADAWAAFYEGVGLSAEEMRLSPDAMRKLGVMYRQVVLGLSDILKDRAAFKDEFRVERTQISIGRNNPLKHLPPFDAAKILLSEPLPGFMDSEDAIRTAFEDAKKHQMAMLAGVQRALSAVFDRLSPAEIEKMIEKATAQRKGLSFRRGVDRWSVYLTVFEALKRDATSNANGVMSVAFREGYEEFLKSAR